MTYPVCCFITFEEERGYDAACGFQSKGEVLLCERIYFAPAAEPTNIIWENRQIEGFWKFLRYLFSLIAIVILIMISFSLILLC